MKTFNLNSMPILDIKPVRWNSFCKRFEGYVHVTRNDTIISAWMCKGDDENSVNEDMVKAMSSAQELMSHYK